MGLMRLRAALVGLMSLVLAAMAGRIFDAWQPVLLIAAAVPAIALLVALGESWFVQAAVALVAVVVAVTLVVVASGGRFPEDAADAWIAGFRRLLSTEWPSPERPDLLGAVAVVLAVGTAIGVLLAGRRRWHLLVLAPPIALYVAIVAASAPAGPALWWLVALAPLGAAVAALRVDHEVGETLRILAGDRQLVPLTLVAAGLALAVSVPLTLTDRADPRTDAAASAVEPLVDPVEAVVALRAVDEPVTLYEITATDDTLTLPSRWRTAALDAYDGQRWTPDVVLGPIGRRLGPNLPDELDVEIRIGADGTSAIPLPGPPVLVAADVETDAARTIVRLLEPADEGTTLEVRSGVEPPRTTADTSTVATRPVDELAGAFTNTAESLAGDGTIAERLTAIEEALRDDYQLDPSAPGAGVQQALIERFLTETKRGTEEQFVAAFVLLARSLGVDARVATGFDTSRAPDGRPGVLRTSDAHVWPEVAIEGDGWVAFDPVPAEVTTDLPEEPPAANPQSPAAAPPPVAPPDDADTSADDSEEPPVAATDGGLPTIAVWAIGTGLALTTVLVPVLLVVGVILGIKHRRRARRLRASDPTRRIRGAWAVATDSLVDAGLRIPPSSTDREIAAAGAPLAGPAAVELERLGSMSSAATYATTEPPATTADDAVAALEQVETSMRASRTRWQRWRWRLSLRSLRRSTRSPVTADDD